MATYASSLIGKVGLEGSEKTKSDLVDIGKKTDDAKEHFKGLKNALSMAGGFAISNIAGSGLGFLKDQLGQAFQQSIDAQAGMAQTNQVLKSTHDVSGMTAGAIADLATQFSHLTMFQDDTVQSAENMLLTFTNIGKKVFPEATKTVLDMSQALGQDTKSSAIQLGKALNDPITGVSALQRVGVTFDDTQKKLIKTYMEHNQVAKAQGVILKELQKEFGGSAVAAGKTFGGQMAILNQRLDDFRQNIGDALLPIVTQFLGYLEQHLLPRLDDFSNWFQKDGIPKITEFGQWFQSDGIPALQDFAGKIGTVVGWLGDFVQGLRDGDPWISALAGGLTAVGTAIGLVKIEEFGAGIYNTFQEMKDGAGIVANLASRELPNLSQALGWTKTAMVDVGTAATEAEATTATAATGMTVAMGIATAGISLAIGAIAALWLSTRNDITTGAHQMSADVQKEYDAMGNSASDNAAKAAAKQAEAATDTSKEIKNQGSRVSEYWVSSYDKASQAADNAKAKMIIDAQLVADATAAAQKEWSAWVNSMWGQGIDVVHGGKVPAPPPTTLPGGQHRPGHASGILNSPYGHWAMVGERGPEAMYVPRGASILPSGTMPGGANNATPVVLMMDSIVIARGLMPAIVDQIRSTGVRF